MLDNYLSMLFNRPLYIPPYAIIAVKGGHVMGLFDGKKNNTQNFTIKRDDKGRFGGVKFDDGDANMLKAFIEGFLKGIFSSNDKKK